MRASLLLVAFWYHGAAAPLCLADEVPTIDRVDKDMARRVEVRNGRTFPEPRFGRLRPEHVYAVYDEFMARWVFTMTDFQGHFANPLEALSPGTVLEGEQVGGDADKRYLLTDKAKWEATKRPLQKRFWLSKNPPEFRITLPVSRTVQVVQPEPSRPVDRRPAGRKLKLR